MTIISTGNIEITRDKSNYNARNIQWLEDRLNKQIKDIISFKTILEVLAPAIRQLNNKFSKIALQTELDELKKDIDVDKEVKALKNSRKRCMNRLNRKQKNTKRWTSWNQVNKMLESHLQEKIKEVKELREFYLECIEYVRNHIVWILDNYKKYGMR